MEQSQHKQRHAAAQEFQKSLDELQQILQDNATQEQEMSQMHDRTDDRQVVENCSAIDLAAWEDAVADIEQYLQEKGKAE
ncbi:MAG: hypothetical protein N2235_17260 [Fischerella sp.]|nr:hypothetical protein [Fischerella sp.]